MRSATESKNAPRTDAVPDALATGPSNRSGQPGGEQEAHAPHEVARAHDEGGHHGHGQPEDGEYVGVDPGTDERPTHGPRRAVYRVAPATVEHVWPIPSDRVHL